MKTEFAAAYDRHDGSLEVQKNGGTGELPRDWETMVQQGVKLPVDVTAPINTYAVVVSYTEIREFGGSYGFAPDRTKLVTQIAEYRAVLDEIEAIRAAPQDYVLGRGVDFTSLNAVENRAETQSRHLLDALSRCSAPPEGMCEPVEINASEAPMRLRAELPAPVREDGIEFLLAPAFLKSRIAAEQVDARATQICFYNRDACPAARSAAKSAKAEIPEPQPVRLVRLAGRPEAAQSRCVSIANVTQRAPAALKACGPGRSEQHLIIDDPVGFQGGKGSLLRAAGAEDMCLERRSGAGQWQYYTGAGGHTTRGFAADFGPCRTTDPKQLWRYEVSQLRIRTKDDQCTQNCQPARKRQGPRRSDPYLTLGKTALFTSQRQDDFGADQTWRLETAF